MFTLGLLCMTGWNSQQNNNNNNNNNSNSNSNSGKLCGKICAPDFGLRSHIRIHLRPHNWHYISATSSSKSTDYHKQASNSVSLFDEPPIVIAVAVDVVIDARPALCLVLPPSACRGHRWLIIMVQLGTFDTSLSVSCLSYLDDACRCDRRCNVLSLRFPFKLWKIENSLDSVHIYFVNFHLYNCFRRMKEVMFLPPSLFFCAPE